MNEIEGNVHYIYAMEDSYLVDILIPNYSDDRRISVFQEIQN